MVCGNPGRAAVVAVGLEQTAAHLVDLVFPQVPVRQWVLSLPKRLRIFLAEVGAAVRSCSPDMPSGERFSAAAVVHRVGSALHSKSLRGIADKSSSGVRVS